MSRMKYHRMAALALVAWASSAFAATYSYDLTQFAAYGNTNQNAAGITNGANACGPTSTINSLQYLQNRMGVTGLVTNPSSNINSLGLLMNLPQGTTGGVTDQNMINGKRSYINTWNTNNPTNQISIEGMGDNITSATGTNYGATGSTPTMAFLQQQLAAGQDVELGFNWTNSTGNGGHWVTVTGMNWNDNNSNNIFDTGDTATLNILDPFGPKSGTGSAVTTTATVTNGTTGNALNHLVITYTGGGANNGLDPDNSLVAGFGFADIAVAESPVSAFATPEPGTLLVVAAGAVLLLRPRRNARRENLPNADISFGDSTGETLFATPRDVFEPGA